MFHTTDLPYADMAMEVDEEEDVAMDTTENDDVHVVHSAATSSTSTLVAPSQKKEEEKKKKEEGSRGGDQNNVATRCSGNTRKRRRENKWEDEASPLKKRKIAEEGSTDKERKAEGATFVTLGERAEQQGGAQGSCAGHKKRRTVRFNENVEVLLFSREPNYDRVPSSRLGFPMGMAAHAWWRGFVKLTTSWEEPGRRPPVYRWQPELRKEYLKEFINSCSKVEIDKIKKLISQLREIQKDRQPPS